MQFKSPWGLLRSPPKYKTMKSRIKRIFCLLCWLQLKKKNLCSIHRSIFLSNDEMIRIDNAQPWEAVTK